MKKLLPLVILLPSISYSGIKGTTFHSRANCLNNESITWWLGNYIHWRTVSTHVHFTGVAHHIDTNWQTTWRSAAVHWNESAIGSDEWEVFGYHYQTDFMKGEMPMAETYANDCDIYTGWWNQ